MTKDVQHRLHILDFAERHGKAAACEAYQVSRRTLYRWQRTLTQAGGNLGALKARSCAPKQRRQPSYPKALADQVRRLRRQFPNLGKAKLHVMLAPWCRQHDIALPSVSTIGRLIARAPDKMRHAPQRLTPKGKAKPRRQRKARKPKGLRHPPLAVFACDTVVRMQDGIRRYLFTFIDPDSRFAVAFAASSGHSRNAAAAFRALCQILPQPPKYLLSDNGSEFAGDFEQQLKKCHTKHWFTYPRSPKMNAHAERFNRTLQEHFVDYHEDLLFTDLAEFNQKMAQWLIQYNTVLPHHSIGLVSPVCFITQKQPECQRYWTHTSGRLMR